VFCSVFHCMVYPSFPSLPPRINWDRHFRLLRASGPLGCAQVLPSSHGALFEKHFFSFLTFSTAHDSPPPILSPASALNVAEFFFFFFFFCPLRNSGSFLADDFLSLPSSAFSVDLAPNVGFAFFGSPFRLVAPSLYPFCCFLVLRYM